MSLKKHVERVAYLDQLIRMGAAGTPEELSYKLGLSRRTWFELKNELTEEFGFPIAYCTWSKRYFYEAEGRFEFGFRRRISDEEGEMLSGGVCKFYTGYTCHMSTYSDYLNTDKATNSQFFL